MVRWKLIIIPLILFLSHWLEAKNRISYPKDSIKIVINGQNLSEDMLFASQNDEIICEIYELADSAILNNPIISENFIFDEQNQIHQLKFASNLLDKAERYLFLLIEYDTQKPSEQRNPIWRIYHQEIRTLYEAGDRIGIGKYLGNDDLLGLKVITGETIINGTNLECKGFHNMDKYHYSIEIK